MARFRLGLIAMAALMGQPVLADPRADLQAACFAPATLAADARERTPVRLSRPVSQPLPSASPTSAPIQTPLRGAIRRVDLPAGSRKLIALTLDFCEQPQELAGYDGAIIDVLRREKVKATLFMGGRWMASHERRTAQLMADPLFEFGTHGLAHRNTRLLAGADLRTEIVSPNAIYAAARTKLSGQQCAAAHLQALSTIPPAPNLFRFPFGACSAEGLSTANDAGLLAIQWDVSTGDPSPATSAREIAATMINRTRPGSIIIAHANGRGHNTAEALPAAIAGLRAKGFEFVTVGELLAAGKPVITSTCFDSRPGDTDKYDTLFAPRGAAPPSAKPPTGNPWSAKTLP
jgi:peptidoglycan-N-acetylglucosamine deacetylase